MAIPGCSLWFMLSIWEDLLRAQHLFRLDQMVSATDLLPGMQVANLANGVEVCYDSIAGHTVGHV